MVRKKLGFALYQSQIGQRHESAKMLHGFTDTVWQVRAAIDTLPYDEATVVRLQHLDGLTHREISEKLGIALGTVKSRSHRAHRALARLLGHLREAPRD